VNRGRLRRLVFGLLFVVSALAVGGGTAAWRVQRLSDIDQVVIGPWRTSTLVGSQHAGAALRAAIAVNGLLAMQSREAIYFIASTDDDGQPLNGRCRYVIVGADPDARWWSLTAYGPDRFLIPNNADDYSVNRDDASRDAAGRFAIELDRRPDVGARIALPEGHFLLTLRLYNPGATIAAHPQAAQLPQIRRQDCDA